MANQTLSSPNVLALSECYNNISTNNRLLALSYSRLISSSLSLLGSVSIIVYVLKKHKLKSSEIHPLFFLAIADILLSAAWVVGNALFLHGHSEPCNIVAWVVWCLELITHMLTVMYALVTWLKLYELEMATNCSREKRAEFNGRRSILQKVLYVLCWILPIALGLPKFLDKVNDGCLRCMSLWAQDPPRNGDGEVVLERKGALSDYATTVFIIVLCLSLLLMLLLYGHVRVMIKRMIRGRGVLSAAERQQEKRMRWRVLLYILVFFICWLPTLVVTMWARIMHRRLDVGKTSEFGVLMGQAWTMTMQGFLNCLVYGWSRVDFRKPKDYQSIPFRDEGINSYGATSAAPSSAPSSANLSSSL